jgi:hypothetical protein
MGPPPVPDELPISHVEAILRELRDGFRDFDRVLRGYNGDAGVMERLRVHESQLAALRAEIDDLRAHPHRIYLSEEVREKTRAAKWRTKGEIATVVGVVLSLILSALNLLGVVP